MSASTPDPSFAGLKVVPDDLDKLVPVETSASLPGGITLTNNDTHRTSPYLNHKIRNICLILSFMVVYNHSHTLEIDYNFWVGANAPAVSAETLRSAPIEVCVQHFFSGALGRITNPMFFAASGFLFFYGWKPTAGSWGRKLRKRVFTLLLPYISWSLIGMFVGYGEFLLRNLYQLTMEKTRGALTLWDILGFAFNMGEPSQLWFLRTLMLMMLGAPILGLIISKLRQYTFLLILIVYYSDLTIPLIYKYSVCFFALGATFGYLKSELTFRVPALRVWIVPAWVGIAFAYASLSLLTDWNLQPLFRTLVLSGLVGIWAAYDLLPQFLHQRLAMMSRYRFFVYMAFDPLLSILQNRYFYFVAPSQAANLVEYFLMPVVVILFCIGVGSTLCRRCPRLYFFLSGGR